MKKNRCANFAITLHGCTEVQVDKVIAKLVSLRSSFFPLVIFFVVVLEMKVFRRRLALIPS